MDGVNGDVVADGFDDGALDVVAAGESFESAEYYRMMGNYKVASVGDGFVEYGFCGVEANNGAGDVHVRAAG